MLTEKGVVERPPLLEGRNMFIVMAPPEKRVEKKTDTIGDALAAKGQTATLVADPEAESNGTAPASAPAEATPEPTPEPIQQSEQG